MARKRMLVSGLVLAGALIGGAVFLLWPTLRNWFRPSDEAIAHALLPDLVSAVGVGRLEIAYPRDGTVFPPELPPPTVAWIDASGQADTWMVAVEIPGGDGTGVILVPQPRWRIPPPLWNALQRSTVDRDARISVVGFQRSRPRQVLSGARIAIRTSPDPVDAPIIYRDVPLPFIYAVEHPDTIRWRLGRVSSPETPPIVLENLPVCGNCHSFSRDGRTLGMDVDYANDKGSYAITSVERITRLSPDHVITWSDFRKEDGKRTFGLLSQVSPDGRYVVSTVKDLSVFVPKDDLTYSQLFFPVMGILVVYDRETKEFRPLPGADDPQFVQSNPVWSPDGSFLLFARAPAIAIPGAEKNPDVILPRSMSVDFIEGRRGIQYDIYRIPFNEGRGGTPQPVPGASQNGMSNYFPRLSPDGRWLVFCQARNFMLLQPDSRLFIMPAEGGPPREMNCNTRHMNSWHSWSPNGRWMVFASKDRSPYTDLYLTHIDAQGMDSPPVLLEHFMLPQRAANIPEFVNLPIGEFERIEERFVNDVSYERQANTIALYRGKPAESLDLYRRALELNPANEGARVNLAVALSSVGNIPQAEAELQIVLQRNPDHAVARRNLANIYMATQRFSAAIDAWQSILKLKPGDVEAFTEIAVAHFRSGHYETAYASFQKLARDDPDNPVNHFNVGSALEALGRRDEAYVVYRRALQCPRHNRQELVRVAEGLIKKDAVRRETIQLLRLVTKEDPSLGAAHVVLGSALLREGDPTGAAQAFRMAIRLEGCPPWVKAKLAELDGQFGGGPR